MKKLMAFSLILISLILSFTGVGTASDNILLKVNGAYIFCDVSPVILNDRTLVPARAIFEPLGATVSWDDLIKEAAIVLNSDILKLKINSKTAYLNGVPCNLDVSSIIINNRTMFPVRFVAEKLGYNVQWDGDKKEVNVNKPTPTPKPTPAPTPKPTPTPISYTNSINAISYCEKTNALVITVKLDKAVGNTENYDLASPDRTVIDFFDVSKGNTANTITIDKCGIQDIRIGQHDGYTRIVVDLVEKKADKIIFSSDRKELYIEYAGANTNTIPTPTPVARQKIVVLDPGHGGNQSGALGIINDEIVIYEKDLNLEMSLIVKRELEAAGVKVVMTRQSDISLSLSERCNISNKANPDVYVSIHNNSMINNGEIKGSVTFYSSIKDKLINSKNNSQALATYINNELVKSLKTVDLGARDGADYAVIGGTNAVAVIIEPLFLSNEDDLALIMQKANVELASKAIANGILKALGPK